MENEIHCEMSHDYQDGILDPSAYEFGNVRTCAEELWVEIDHTMASWIRCLHCA